MSNHIQTTLKEILQKTIPTQPGARSLDVPRGFSRTSCGFPCLDVLLSKTKVLTKTYTLQNPQPENPLNPKRLPTRSSGLPSRALGPFSYSRFSYFRLQGLDFETKNPKIVLENSRDHLRTRRFVQTRPKFPESQSSRKTATLSTPLPFPGAASAGAVPLGSGRDAAASAPPVVRVSLVFAPFEGRTPEVALTVTVRIR